MAKRHWGEMTPDERLETLRRDLSNVEARENVLIAQVNSLQSEVQFLHAELSRLAALVNPQQKAKT